MRLVRTVFLAPLALLAACGTAPQSTSGPDVAVSAPVPAAADAQDAARPDGEAADPSRLKGLSPPQVHSVLGKPVFTRRDAPAEIWQYRGRACTLDLFLYDEGGSQTVAYYAVRSPQPVNESQCMGELVGRNQGVPAS
jgi:hypothetical protein